MVQRIISGGQTGADQGFLYGARSLGIPTGGTAPINFQTEVGDAPWLVGYGLVAHGDYRGRTWRNVADSDGTLIVGNLGSAGCTWTLRCCLQLKKPWFHVNGVNVSDDAEQVHRWLCERTPATLNGAGNRESRNPGLCWRVQALLLLVWGKQ